MATVNPPRIRKRLMGEASAPSLALPSTEIQLAAHATIHYSSKDPVHPIEHLFDGASGRGATRWVSAQFGTTQEILLEFDEAQHISRLIADVEERQLERTQEVRMEFSSDGGESYRTGFVQEYTFSPNSSTYQREDLSFDLREITQEILNECSDLGVRTLAGVDAVALVSHCANQRPQFPSFLDRFSRPAPVGQRESAIKLGRRRARPRLPRHSLALLVPLAAQPAARSTSGRAS